MCVRERERVRDREREERKKERESRKIASESTINIFLSKNAISFNLRSAHIKGVMNLS